jgi:hypothetical protein
VQSQQSPAAVPVDPVAAATTTRAAHQAQMATAAELLKKAELLPPEVNIVSAALSTSAQYGANSLLLARDYRKLGDKILKLSEPDQAVIKANVSSSITQSVRNVIDVKGVIEDKYKVKLQLGVNDAGEIVVMAPPRPEIPSQRRAMTTVEMQAAAAPVINTAYTQATAEFNKQLKPMLSNMVFGRAMLTTEQPKAVGQDFATLINNNQPYGGFFSMQAQPAAATATPAAPAQATPAAPAASAASAAGGKRTASMADVARYAASKGISVQQAVSQLEADGVDVVGN